MQVATVQLLAVLMAVSHGAVWVLVSRWERPGRTVRLRASLPLPHLAVRGGYVALAVPLLYPAVVVIAPRWSYEGPLNWSSQIDVFVLGLGVGLWFAGTVLLVWAARVMGRFMAVDGVTEDHTLVESGPYRYVRHPVYASFTVIAAGLALVFRSYLLAVVAALWLAASMRWAAAEETLLRSPEGLGDAYGTYTERTGRFLPRLRGSDAVRRAQNGS